MLRHDYISVDIESVTAPHPLQGGGRTLSSRRTAPLKPKPGLSGPPVPDSVVFAEWVGSVKTTSNVTRLKQRKELLRAAAPGAELQLK